MCKATFAFRVDEKAQVVKTIGRGQTSSYQFPQSFFDLQRESSSGSHKILEKTCAPALELLQDYSEVVVRPGQFASLQVEAYRGEIFEGQVLRVGRASDVLTKKFPVQIEVSNSDGRLLPGMIATVRVNLNSAAERLLVPRDATLKEFGLVSVFVIETAPAGEGFVARRRRIKVRAVPFEPVSLEVLSGLTAGERIALSQVRQLRDGERVLPVATEIR